jgi:ATP-dependent DNA helicase RecG
MLQDDRVFIWSPGELLPGMTVDDLLRRPHDSRPRNPLLARVFYCPGWIEHWGSGVTRILDLCQAQGLPAPQFISAGGRFEVTFAKDRYTEAALRNLGLNERQFRAVLHVKENGRISNTEYQQLYHVSKRTASEDLRKLENLQIFERVGTRGKGTYYQLLGQQWGEKGN